MYIYYLQADADLNSSNIYISDVVRGQITFQWNSVLTDCPFVLYKINDSGCSNCTNTSTTFNFITCNVSLCLIHRQAYTLTVQAVVCDNVSGVTDEISVDLIKGLL